MNLSAKLIANRQRIKIALIILCVAYPLIGAFFGLDLGDTGYHLFAFENLRSNPDKINYTTYLTTVVGYLWGKIFGGMGLIAYNLLEVILEWAIIWIVYRTFKDICGEITTLAGSLLAVTAADAYLNIFNYHQFNAFLLVVMLCLEYRAITENKLKLSIYAGAMYTIVVFARVGSVIAVVTLLLYLYDTIMYGGSFKKMWKHIGCCVLGAALSCAVLLAVLYASGTLQNFYDNIIRLRDIASDESTSYGFSNLLSTLIIDNLNVMASGGIFFASIAALACAFNIGYAKQDTLSKRILSVFAACFIGFIAVYQMYYAFNVNPAEDWPQMTSGQRFIIGVMYVAVFALFMMHAFKKSGDTRRSRRLTLLALASYMLVILTIAGSNTGTKHVILGLWLIAPAFLCSVKTLFFHREAKGYLSLGFQKLGLKMDKKTLISVLLVASVMFLSKFTHMLVYTFNYDSIDRTKLTSTVGAWNVRGIYTTEREADAIRGVLENIGAYEELQKNAEGDEAAVSVRNRPLMVFGNTLLFYYLTGKESYGAAWVTSATYSYDRFRTDIEKAREAYGEHTPIAIYCKINYAYGFEEEKYAENLERERSTWYSGKKEFFPDFLEEYNYGISYQNDYYAVLTPGWNEDFRDMEWMILGYSRE